MWTYIINLIMSYINVIYFCIVVYNGTGHILLLDFLWAHPNSLDWPIKSSGGPNNVCDIYI